jgi:hypothetical protein
MALHDRYTMFVLHREMNIDIPKSGRSPLGEGLFLVTVVMVVMFVMFVKYWVSYQPLRFSHYRHLIGRSGQTIRLLTSLLRAAQELPLTDQLSNLATDIPLIFF